MSAVLIDTSAWVDFLRPGVRPLGERVDELLDSDRAQICGVVVAELLHGVKGAAEEQQMCLLLGSVQRLGTLEHDWDEAGRVLQRLGRKGITVPLADALIAVIARRNGVAVLTADEHFRHLGVEVYPV